MSAPDIHYHVLDVRPLQHQRQEPFSVIMSTVQGLGQGEGLLLINTFEPVPLYRVMERMGFAHHTEEREEGAWYVWFHRNGTTE